MTDVVRTVPDAKPALILFGNDKKGRPHAAWFADDEAVNAERASEHASYTALRITGEEEQALAAKLPHGRMLRHGGAHVPALPRSLFNVFGKLTASQRDATGIIDDGRSTRKSANTTNVEPKPKSSSMALVVVNNRSPVAPHDWSEIGLGSQVLAYDPPSEAWYEAFVVNALNDTFRLTWRDYPEEGIVTRQRNQLALLHPAD